VGFDISIGVDVIVISTVRLGVIKDGNGECVTISSSAGDA
jgi:hypothetical protein